MTTGRRGLKQAKGPLRLVVDRGLHPRHGMPMAELACGHYVADVHKNRSRRMRCYVCHGEQEAVSA